MGQLTGLVATFFYYQTLPGETYKKLSFSDVSGVPIDWSNLVLSDTPGERNSHRAGSRMLNDCVILVSRETLGKINFLRAAT